MITQFLADLKESHLLPASGTVDAALKRARIAFFVDTFNTKIISGLYGTLRADSEEEKIAKGTQFVEAIEKEIAPLLEGAGPFFGGSKELTLAEVRDSSDKSIWWWLFADWYHVGRLIRHHSWSGSTHLSRVRMVGYQILWGKD